MYKMSDCSIKYLLSNGFCMHQRYGSREAPVFVKRISAYRYNFSICIDAEFRVYQGTGTVAIDVYDESSRSRYAPYYYEKGKQSKVVRIIQGAIDEAMKKYGIYEEDKEHGADQDPLY